MQYFGFDRPSFGIKTYGFGANFDPLDLFAGSKQGVWYDPSDKSTLFQDVAGTVPVTKDGDPVALMKDKSGNGNHATMGVSTARPIYRTDGFLQRLTFDGVDDHLLFNKNTFLADKSQVLMTAYSLLSNGEYPAVITGLSGTAGVEQIHYHTAAMRRVAVVTNTGLSSADSATPLPLSTAIVRTTNWSRSAGVATDTANRAGTFTTSPAQVNALLILPTDYQSMGCVIKYYANMDFYGIVAISDDLSPTAIADVEQYLAAKSGVTL